MKKFALFLTLVFVLTCAVPALAADNMTGVVLSVKNKVPVPAECTEFNGSPYTNNGKSEWHLSWRTPDSSENYMYVSAEMNENDVITYYYFSDRTERYGKALPKITKDAALQTAAAFFAKANPEIAAAYDFGNADVYYEYSTYYVNADRTENGIPVYGDSAQIEVNGTKGMVTSMRVSYTPDIIFESFAEAMTEEQVKAVFEKKGGLELLYKSYYTADGEVKTAYPVYVSSGKGILINALTGEEVTDNGGEYIYNSLRSSSAKAEMTADSASGGAQLTQQEIDEIEKLAGLISRQQAEEILKGMSELNIGEDAAVTHSSIYKNGSDGYIMDISLEGDGNYCSAALDAETGELIRFYGYSDSDSGQAVYTAEQGEKAADDFTEKYFAGYVNTSVKSENITYNEKDAEYRQSWTRTENGLNYEQNSMSVTVDLNSLKITSFNLNWDKNMVFESIDDIIDATDAYDSLFGYISPVFVYYVNSDKTAVPVYVTQFDGFDAINAKSGKATDYNGYEYITQSEQEYTDISGHYAEDEIRALAGIGVRLKGSQFNPDGIITQGEYLELVSNCVMNYYPITGGRADEAKIYSNAVSNGIIKKDEVTPEDPLTRELAVAYLLRAMNYAEFAQIEGIFKCDFADVSDISESLFGYVAIAKGLKIISGTDGNLFLPQKQMTRAEACIVIYNYLNR